MISRQVFLNSTLLRTSYNILRTSSPALSSIHNNLHYSFLIPSYRLLSTSRSTATKQSLDNDEETEYEKKQRIKKVMGRGSLLALITIVPVFYWLQSKIFQKRPVSEYTTKVQYVNQLFTFLIFVINHIRYY